MQQKYFFIGLSIVCAFFCVLIGCVCFSKKTKIGYWLGMTACCIIFTTISYCYSLVAPNNILMPLFSSLYSLGIAWGLRCLLIVVIDMTYKTVNKVFKVINNLITIYLCIDTIFFLINPFVPITVEYIVIESGGYLHVGHWPFYTHLLFCYLMIASCFVILVIKGMKVPKTYASYYLNPIIAIIIIVLFNTIYLFSSTLTFFENLQGYDYSIFGYTIILIMFYWNTYEFVEGNMKNTYRNWIFDNVNEGIIVFGYDDTPVLYNKQFLNITHTSEVYDLQHYIDYFNFDSKSFGLEEIDFQLYVSDGKQRNPIEFQYHPVIEDDCLTGKIFVLTQNDNKIDSLTGFDDFDHFLRSISNKTQTSIFKELVVSIFDINSLSSINNRLGKKMGDDILTHLSIKMRKFFPEDTHFVRGNEAKLIALNNALSEEKIVSIINNVIKEFADTDYDGEHFSCEAVYLYNYDNLDVPHLINNAEKTLESKKLLSLNSLRSENLSSLIKILEQTDSSTTQHVVRTRILGERLGKRLNFSQLQLNRLSLLCLIHDIGKIGIPLEILNKPTKLDNKEFDVIKMHVQKGYQICKSTESAKDVAEEVLYHHERWDGKGYPSGLSKESIPILSRVISIVDAFDAMVNDRVYHKAISYQNALGELQVNAGSQFDPFITAEFIEMMKEDGFEVSIVLENTGEFPPINTNSLQTSNKIDFVSEVSFTRYVMNEQYHIIEVDNNFEKLIGFNSEDIKTGLSQWNLIPPEDQLTYKEKVNKALKKNDLFAVFEHRVNLKDGSQKFFLGSAKNFYDSITHQAKIEVLLIDILNGEMTNKFMQNEIDKFNEKERIWEQKYRHDTLTGLLNREAFSSEVDYRILKADSNVLFVYMDINKFKSINDEYGHVTGDECLTTFASILKKTLRKDDLCSRMGGDEFACALFFPKNISNESMVKRAYSLFEKLNKELEILPYKPTISMGAIAQNNEFNTFTKLYKESDKYLYKAKENQIHFASKEK